MSAEQFTERKAELARNLRGALSRHGARITRSTSMDTMIRHVERITGRPVSNTPAQRAQDLRRFCERRVADGMPVKVWKPLVGYEANLRKLQEISAISR